MKKCPNAKRQPLEFVEGRGAESGSRYSSNNSRPFTKCTWAFVEVWKAFHHCEEGGKVSLQTATPCQSENPFYFSVLAACGPTIKTLKPRVRPCRSVLSPPWPLPSRRRSKHCWTLTTFVVVASRRVSRTFSNEKIFRMTKQVERRLTLFGSIKSLLMTYNTNARWRRLRIRWGRLPGLRNFLQDFLLQSFKLQRGYLSEVLP